MRFSRFNSYGFLSNWGWYSPKEKELLETELKVGQYLASLEDFVRRKQLVKNLIQEFQAIQNRNDVKESEYGALQVKLESLADQARKIRLEVLSRGGSDIPDAPKTFPNHHPTALIGEIRSFLEYRKQNRHRPNPFSSGFVIHYHATTAVAFKAIVNTGSKVLYTLDVNGILSIGDPKSTKHSVVAVGKECKAAGIAQLEIDDRRDLYEGMKDCERKAQDMQEDLNKQGDDREGSKKANITYYQQQAKERKIQLQGWTPPVQDINTVLIDFDSGHYAPRQAWKEALQAWRAAGYAAKWNPNSKWV